MTKASFKISLFMLAVLLASVYYFEAYYLPEQKEQTFLARMYKPLAESRMQFRLSELTDFAWDNVDIVIQLDDSWDEGAMLNFIKGRHYEFNYFDVFYWPRLLNREYEAAFLFTKEKKVVGLIRLDTRDLIVGNTVYYFDPITRYADGKDFIVKGHDPRPAPQWLKDAFPKINNQANLTFYKPKEK